MTADLYGDQRPNGVLKQQRRQAIHFTGFPYKPAKATIWRWPPGHDVSATSARPAPDSISTHASGASDVVRRPACSSIWRIRARPDDDRNCITIEWKTTVSTPLLGARSSCSS